MKNDFDEQLQQLAIEAKEHPPLSPQRQLALNRLVNQILQSDRISHPQKGLWPYSIYEDLYNEALQKTSLEICKNIDRYKPEHPVMAWVNFLLGKRFQDVVKEYLTQGATHVSLSGKVISLVDLETGISSEDEMLSESEMLKQFLEEDPENLLTNEHIRGKPQANFQYIAIARIVEDKTWEAISTELGVAHSTLNNFFDRRLRKLMPYFEKYLK